MIDDCESFAGIYNSWMSWKLGGPSGQIGEAETHVWRIKLDLVSVDPLDLQRVLALEEQSRADKFYREMDRRRYQVTRFALRDILSKYSLCEAEKIEFDYNQFGKPLVQGKENLRFNVSHAGEVSLIAVAQGREVGVDVEQVQEVSSDDPASLYRIAQRFFAPNEVRQLRQLPEAALVQAFFTCWTRKEAFIKAKGLGLAIPLDSFEVSFLPSARPELISFEADLVEKERWSFYALEPLPGYVGALVVEGKHLDLSCWDWRS